jgi:3-methylcrotonyl-CoA carboxylase beta subunit
MRHGFASAGKARHSRLYHSSVLPSLLSTSSPEFQAKSEAMDLLVAEYESRVAKARLGGGEKAAQRMISKGKKLPRERFVGFHPCSTMGPHHFLNRLSLLLDPHTPFLELSQLAAHDVYTDDVPGAGIITGIGRISGRECVVVVNDATVKGGSYYPLTVSLIQFIEGWQCILFNQTFR